MAANGFSVRIFIPSGEPDGLKTVEKSLWTGHGLVFPRPLFSEARRRDELKRPGVYVLWGPGESGQLPKVYVGEGDPVLDRIEQHARNKDFWTHAAVFTGKDQYVNKAHVQYLESRLVDLATKANRCELDNNNEPQLPALSEADVADAEAFLANVLLCLPVVGVTVFERANAGSVKGTDLHLKGKGIDATGAESPEGFVVRAGATAVKDEVPSIDQHPQVRALRSALITKGVLVDQGAVYRLKQDYVFSSPSIAAGVFLGGGANGRALWKDSRGKTLKEIQDQEAGGE